MSAEMDDSQRGVPSVPEAPKMKHALEIGSAKNSSNAHSEAGRFGGLVKYVKKRDAKHGAKQGSCYDVTEIVQAKHYSRKRDAYSDNKQRDLEGRVTSPQR
jgi:hypothetical protein